jgi:hypothetical protein
MPWSTRPVHRELDGERGDCRPDDEDGEAGEQDALPRNEIRKASDEREHRHIAEEEAGDDRGRLLERVDPDADTGHHVGQGDHDDIRVRRGQCHRRRGGGKQGLRGG